MASVSGVVGLNGGATTSVVGVVVERCCVFCDGACIPKYVDFLC